MSEINWAAVEEIYREHVPAGVGGAGNFIGRTQNVLRRWAEELRAQGGEGVYEYRAVMDFAERLAAAPRVAPLPAQVERTAKTA